MTRPIGILGGTFDPVHHGHLRMALECYERLDLSEVRLIPLHTPPHRNLPVATPEQRLAMLELAINNLQGLTVDDCELHRQNISYTIDTLQLVRQKVGNTPLCLLIGTDAFKTLNTWHNWQALLEQTHIVIAERPGSPVKPESSELAELLKQHGTGEMSQLHEQPSGRIYEVFMPLLDISATQIRDIFHTKRNPDFLLPDEVIDFIYTNNIYQTG
jgi:nicotinate-nucleotide adenylyltransferase